MTPSASKETHERKLRGLIRVKTADIMQCDWFTEITVDLVAVTGKQRRKNAFPTYLYVSRLYDHRDDYHKAALRTKPFAMTSWSLHSTVEILKTLGIPYEHMIRITETKGVTEDEESAFVIALIERIPMMLVNEVAWVKDDPRRYMLILNSPRSALSRVDKRSVIKSVKNKTLALIDNESEAMRMKLAYGGHLYDMESLRETI